MLVREEIAFLRETAQQAREMARIERAISAELLRMADDLDARADKLQRVQDRQAADELDHPNTER